MNRPLFMTDTGRDMRRSCLTISSGMPAWGRNPGCWRLAWGQGKRQGLSLATGAQVTALEPGSALAAFARERFAGHDNLRVEEADFEGFHPGEEIYDLIYSATAFHWIRPEVGFPKLRALLKRCGGRAFLEPSLCKPAG